MNLKEYKQPFKRALLSTLLFSMFTHGYRFINLFNAHDSMLNIVQDDVAWERSLGRFMHPLIMVLRGAICAPWLLCVCSVVFMGLSVFLISILLKQFDRITIVLISGILTCNIVMTSLYAAFLPWADVYAIALFLCLLGVWCVTKKGWLYFVAGCLSLIMSMGFYQAYICVTLGVMLILIIMMLAEGMYFGEVIRKALRYVMCVIVSAIVYYVSYKLVCVIHNVELAKTYNGLASLGDYGGVSILGLIGGAYKEFFSFLVNSNTFANIILLNIKVMDMWNVLLGIVNICVVLTILLGLIRINYIKKNPWWKWLLQFIGVSLFPLAVNFVYILSKGMEHELMIFAFVLIYVLAIVVVNANVTLSSKENKNIRVKFVNKILVVVAIGLVIWNNAVYSNQIYFKLHLQQEATQSMITKILYEIEHLEEYEYGTTPVAFVGRFSGSDYIANPEYFNEVIVYGTAQTPFTYTNTVKSYLKYYLNNKMSVIEVNPEEEIIKQMPCYPEQGSIAFVDGVVVVKVSE